VIVYELNLKRPVALMLFAAILAGLGAGPLFAQDAKSAPTSATSSHAAIKSNQAEHQAGLTASTGSEGLTRARSNDAESPAQMTFSKV
jgi:hypothetical protein